MTDHQKSSGDEYEFLQGAKASHGEVKLQRPQREEKWTKRHNLIAPPPAILFTRFLPESLYSIPVQETVLLFAVTVGMAIRLFEIFVQRRSEPQINDD